MTFNTDNVSITFNHCESCNGFRFSLGEEFLSDNIGNFNIDSIILSIGDTDIDIINNVVDLVLGTNNSISVTNGSASVSGTNTDFITEFSEGDYILIKTANESGFYKILTINDPMSLTLSTSFLGTTASSLTYYKVSYSIPIELNLPDALYDIKVSFQATDINSVSQEYMLISKNLFLCHAKCCMSKMFAMLPNKLCDNCNTSQFISDLMMMQSLIYGLENSICCPDENVINNILSTITKICKYNNCETC